MLLNQLTYHRSDIGPEADAHVQQIAFARFTAHVPRPRHTYSMHVCGILTHVRGMSIGLVPTGQSATCLRLQAARPPRTRIVLHIHVRGIPGCLASHAHTHASAVCLPMRHRQPQCRVLTSRPLFGHQPPREWNCSLKAQRTGAHGGRGTTRRAHTITSIECTLLFHAVCRVQYVLLPCADVGGRRGKDSDDDCCIVEKPWVE